MIHSIDTTGRFLAWFWRRLIDLIVLGNEIASHTTKSEDSERPEVGEGENA